MSEGGISRSTIYPVLPSNQLRQTNTVHLHYANQVEDRLKVSLVLIKMASSTMTLHTENHNLAHGDLHTNPTSAGYTPSPDQTRSCRYPCISDAAAFHGGVCYLSSPPVLAMHFQLSTDMISTASSLSLSHLLPGCREVVEHGAYPNLRLIVWQVPG